MTTGYYIIILLILGALYVFMWEDTKSIALHPTLQRILKDLPKDSATYPALIHDYIDRFLEVYRMSFVTDFNIGHKLAQMMAYQQKIEKYMLELKLRLPGDIRSHVQLDNDIRLMMHLLDAYRDDVMYRWKGLKVVGSSPTQAVS